MKYDCDVIRDLLPLYQDGVTSAKTSEIVREHLAGCEACRRLLNEPDAQPLPPPPNVGAVVENPEIVQYGRRVQARRKKIKLIVGSIIGLLLLVIAGLSVFLYFLIWGGPPTVTHDPNQYSGDFSGFKGYSNLYIFPVDLPESMKIKDYYYFYQDTFLDPTYQIYLDYTLSEADYQAEVQRLSEIRETSGSEVNAIVYDTETFAYPAYVTILGNNLTYEYALLIEEEHRIICVFTQFAYRKDIQFDPQYLPKNFQSIDGSNVDTLGGYNIYYFSMGEGAWHMDNKERKPEEN